MPPRTYMKGLPSEALLAFMLDHTEGAPLREHPLGLMYPELIP